MNTIDNPTLEASLKALDSPSHRLDSIQLLKGWLQSPFFQALRRKQEDEPLGAWIHASNRLKFVPKDELSTLPDQYSQLYGQAKEHLTPGCVVILLEEPIEELEQGKPTQVGGWVCQKPNTSTTFTPLLANPA